MKARVSMKKIVYYYVCKNWRKFIICVHVKWSILPHLNVKRYSKMWLMKETIVSISFITVNITWMLYIFTMPRIYSDTAFYHLNETKIIFIQLTLKFMQSFLHYHIIMNFIIHRYDKNIYNNLEFLWRIKH